MNLFYLSTGKAFKGNSYKYKNIYSNKLISDFFPMLLDENGDFDTFCPSPFHGRSVVVHYNKKTQRYIVIKGCGLTYFPYNFTNTGEVGDGTWGLLLKDDAIRDYICGDEISKLGIYTNKMEAVLKITNFKFNTGKNILNPYILQYSVDCPYRLADAPFLPIKIIKKYVKKWGRFGKAYNQKHLIVADVVFNNLKIMHDNEILHNAINIQNYTLSLELLDFELSRTPDMPYSKEDELIFKDLFKREVFHCLEIINFICYLFKENMDSKELGQILKKYGYSM
mgnify:CR=1 FL=1|jgi:hypothetical protein